MKSFSFTQSILGSHKKSYALISWNNKKTILLESGVKPLDTAEYDHHISGLSSQELIMGHLKLPKINESKLKKALPYLIEPEILHPIEGLETRYKIVNSQQLNYWICKKSKVNEFLLNNSIDICSGLPLALEAFSQEYLPYTQHLHLFIENEQATAIEMENNIIQNFYYWEFQNKEDISSQILKHLQTLSTKKHISQIALSGYYPAQLKTNLEKEWKLAQFNHVNIKQEQVSAAIGYALLGSKKKPILFSEKKQFKPLIKKLKYPLIIYFFLCILLTTCIGSSLFFLNHTENKSLEYLWENLIQKTGLPTKSSFSSLSQREKKRYISILKRKVDSIPEGFSLSPDIQTVSDLMNEFQKLSTVLKYPGKIHVSHFHYFLDTFPKKGEELVPYEGTSKFELEINDPSIARKLREELSKKKTEQLSWQYDGKKYFISFPLQKN